LKSKSTKEVAQKSRKTGCPPGLKTWPLFPIGWIFSAFFCFMCESCLGRWTTNKGHCLAKLKTHSHFSSVGCGEGAFVHLSLSFILRNILGRGVQKYLKPKTQTENPIPEPIIFSGYRFGYGSGTLPKRVPENPKKKKLNFFFLKSVEWAG